MEALIVVILSLLLWLLLARFNYRMLVHRSWPVVTEYGGGKPTSCVHYMRAWHPAHKCCEHCASWSKEDFAAERIQRMWTALLGPLLFIALATHATITARQPLTRNEQAARLAKAEEELSKATAELDRLQGK